MVATLSATPPNGREDSLDSFLSSHIFTKGFIVPEGFNDPPPPRLDAPYDIWDDALSAASGVRLHVADDSDAAEQWRQSLRKMPVLPVSRLLRSRGQLLSARRALAFLVHLYVHSLPEGRERIVPAPIAIPFLILSHELDIPPILLFADTEFWNFSIPPGRPLDAGVEMGILSNFSNTPDEAFFYITGLLIELEGVSALHLMHDAIRALRHPDGAADLCAMPALLYQLAARIQRMAATLDGVRAGCDANIYYDEVRLWFNGSPGDPASGWRFAIEGGADTDAGALRRALEESEWVHGVNDGVAAMVEMAGTSAAQSSTVQALDAFLGIDRHTHETTRPGDAKPSRGNFLELMRQYMPRTHREFIECLAVEGAMLREWVDRDADANVKAAYNASVEAMRRFRTVHIKIATLYIVNPKRRAAAASGVGSAPSQTASSGDGSSSASLGTGGTAAIPFLKGIRNRTAGATV